MALYEALKESGVPLDHHASDLYCKVNETSVNILAGYDVRPVSFISAIDGQLWYDLPFQYAPYWAEREASR